MVRSLSFVLPLLFSLSSVVKLQGFKSVTRMASYWILKSEPAEYSIDSLQEEDKGQWDGIRNYQARNFMREMNEDDIAYFYHSSCKFPGIYGKMKITKTAYSDPTAVDVKSKYVDKKSLKAPETNPWVCVDVQFQEKYNIPLLLPDIKKLPLGTCPLTAKGNRLSVISITEDQYELLNREISSLNDILK